MVEYRALVGAPHDHESAPSFNNAGAHPGKDSRVRGLWQRLLVIARRASDRCPRYPRPSAQDSQQQKKEFLECSTETATLSTHRLQLPVSPYQILAGTVIPAALITGIDSDLPGVGGEIVV